MRGNPSHLRREGGSPAKSPGPHCTHFIFETRQINPTFRNDPQIQISSVSPSNTIPQISNNLFDLYSAAEEPTHNSRIQAACNKSRVIQHVEKWRQHNPGRMELAVPPSVSRIGTQSSSTTRSPKLLRIWR